MLDFSTQTPQMMMLVGIVVLGWTLVRRQLKARKRSRQDDRQHRIALKEMGKQRPTSLPLADAPVETLRWQVAMFDLQRELKAELETKISVVHSLLAQVDERIAQLQSLQPQHASFQLPPPPLSEHQLQRAAELQAEGVAVSEIASELRMPVGDVELALAACPPKSGSLRFTPR